LCGAYNHNYSTSIRLLFDRRPTVIRQLWLNPQPTMRTVAAADEKSGSVDRWVRERVVS